MVMACWSRMVFCTWVRRRRQWIASRSPCPQVTDLPAELLVPLEDSDRRLDQKTKLPLLSVWSGRCVTTTRILGRSACRTILRETRLRLSFLPSAALDILRAHASVAVSIPREHARMDVIVSFVISSTRRSHGKPVGRRRWRIATLSARFSRQTSSPTSPSSARLWVAKWRTATRSLRSLSLRSFLSWRSRWMPWTSPAWHDQRFRFRPRRWEAWEELPTRCPPS
mmetsp:Transcript_42420/g.92516  ORF Transcript_42420/g.92516 Transcript_42420/m.92516 type:complete len:225 (-) Transcript_42420:447-1121(-)